MPKIKSVRMLPVFGWVIKHRGANHKTAGSFYERKEDALRDFRTIPGGVRGGGKFCQGCGIGCSDEYEVVKVEVKQVSKIL